MQKNLPSWAFGALSVVGLVLVGSMVLNWVFDISGLRLAWDSNHWLFLVPVIGAALLAAASTRSVHTRLAAIVAGTAIAGYVLINVATSMIHSGVDTWLILGGAGAMLAGSSQSRTMWRAAGGVAVLVGFFAPWADFSMWDQLTSGYGPAGLWGLSMRVLWLVPAAGALGIISAGNAVLGSRLAASAGIAIYGALLWAIGSAAFFVYGLGAWAALGGSLVALAIGVLAREPAPPAADLR